MCLELVGGLDDVATERQLTSGWGFVVLPKTIGAEFSIAAKKLLPSAIGEFHARMFNPTNPHEHNAYADFLSLIRRTAEVATGSLLACSLNEEGWHKEFTAFTDRLVTNTLRNLGVNDRTVIDGAQQAALPIFTLQRLLCSPSAVLRRLEIDENTEMGRFVSQTAHVHGRSLHAPRLLALLADAYRKSRFPRSPQLDRSGLSIVDSSKSFLVQAADVLANFSMNYVIRSLGPTTAGRAAKAQIFEDVFQDVLSETEFGRLCSLSGSQLELAIKQSGTLTFRVEHPSCPAAAPL